LKTLLTETTKRNFFLSCYCCNCWKGMKSSGPKYQLEILLPLKTKKNLKV
jgi:hypothetical protein